jgi:hypothetical protein
MLASKGGRLRALRWALVLLVLLSLVDWSGAFWGPVLSLTRLGRRHAPARTRTRRRSVVRRRLLRLAATPFKGLVKRAKPSSEARSGFILSKVNALTR